MGKGKVRTLLMSCVMMLLCAAMIVGGTFALWSDSAKVENHLTAGTLKVKLERISLTKTYLDNDTGYLVTTVPDTSIVDFTDTNTANANVFGIDNEEKVVPCSKYEATLRLTNNGDVAFSYDVIIQLTSASNALAEQLKIYVDGEDKGTLDEYVADGKAIIATQTMAKNDAAKEFTVKVEFINDDSVNNDAQSKEVKFDLLVNAVQKTTAN
ncbi:MAG: SipW-dependent-type signal peptide-containing protein [Clostridia bacterium]|nr:SipW-dependent-type signal peptide-containing protein [Clostridia bacterium]